MTVPPLHAIFDAARQFGLSDGEVWTALDECADRAGDEATLGEYVDELAGALASRILANQRRILAERPGIPIEQPGAVEHTEQS